MVAPRAYSTKTRIKTLLTTNESPSFGAPRAYSTKTRIKTPDVVFVIGLILREHIPLKQGLRPQKLPNLFSPNGSESIFH